MIQLGKVDRISPIYFPPWSSAIWFRGTTCNSGDLRSAWLWKPLTNWDDPPTWGVSPHPGCWLVTRMTLEDSSLNLQFFHLAMGVLVQGPQTIYAWKFVKWTTPLSPKHWSQSSSTRSAFKVVLRGSNLPDPWRMPGLSACQPRLVLNLESIMQTPVVKAPSCASWFKGRG